MRHSTDGNRRQWSHGRQLSVAPLGAMQRSSSAASTHYMVTLAGLDVATTSITADDAPKATVVLCLCYDKISNCALKWKAFVPFLEVDHLKMEGDLLSMASTQRLKLFQGSQAFPSNLHRLLLSKLSILRNLGDKESW
ncbi:hypothetical protein ZIOFF_041668 [Zingiber officinale]|uniref:Uncharacterized protein n=1 Tax=Zingiber officinale TaxID=94328 RepID=A0A8J5GE73_ZINOF|nr:hypothetical protein ZIOFF_041668 [Zingiber officinale]